MTVLCAAFFLAWWSECSLSVFTGQVGDINFPVAERPENNIDGAQGAFAAGFPAGPGLLTDLEQFGDFPLLEAQALTQSFDLLGLEQAQVPRFGLVNYGSGLGGEVDFAVLRVAPGRHFDLYGFGDAFAVKGWNMN